jgi:hypothetical protein
LAFAGTAAAYDGIENPKLGCGVISTAFAKTVVAENGSMTGSAADAFVKSRFPLGLSGKEALQRARDLALVCEQRPWKAFTQKGEYRMMQRLACKSEPAACDILNSLSFPNAVEPQVSIYLDGDRVEDRSIDWPFTKGSWTF